MADLETLEELDSFAKARNQLRRLAECAGEWAGIPLGIEGEELVVEPRYLFADIFKPALPQDDPEALPIRSVFWSTKYRCKFAILERPNGKVVAQPLIGTGNAATMLLSTLGCSFAWGIEQESAAVHLLGTLVRHHAFKCYMLTGTFLESSSRSGVTYLFRRLRPTVAMKEHKGTMRILACLCQHPIAYYAGTWAGAMTPTDDVVAHLMLMRGDEAMFWRRSNQHPAHQPEAGL